MTHFFRSFKKARSVTEKNRHMPFSVVMYEILKEKYSQFFNSFDFDSVLLASSKIGAALSVSPASPNMNLHATIYLKLDRKMRQQQSFHETFFQSFNETLFQLLKWTLAKTNKIICFERHKVCFRCLNQGWTSFSHLRPHFSISTQRRASFYKLYFFM